MKKSVFLLLFALLCASISTYSQEKLKIVYAYTGNGNALLQGSKSMRAYLKNVSNEPITVFDPNKVDLELAGIKFIWFTEGDESSESGKIDAGRPFKESKKEMLITLNPQDSVVIGYFSLKLPNPGIYKVYSVYVQKPDVSSAECQKKFGKDLAKISNIEIESDTLYADFRVVTRPMEKELTYEDLLKETDAKRTGTKKNYVYPEWEAASALSKDGNPVDVSHIYKLILTPKDKKYFKYVDKFKNLRWLYLTLEPGDTIPDFVKSLDKLMYLNIFIASNEKKRIAPPGFEKLANLTTLKYLKITDTFLKEFPVWIFNNKELETLSLFAVSDDINPEGFTKLSKLNELILWNSVPNQAIPKDIYNMGSLEKLSLYRYNTEYPKDFLQKKPNLKKLAITTYSVDGFPDLTNSTLEALTLQVLDCPTINSYPKGLETIKSLKELTIYGCYGNLQFPDMSASENLESVDILNRSMTEIPSNLEKLRTVKSFKLKAPEVPENK
jgi:hypothetical protein